MKKLLLLSLFATTICFGSQKNNSSSSGFSITLPQKPITTSHSGELKISSETITALTLGIKTALSETAQSLELKKTAEGLNETAKNLSIACAALGTGLDTKTIAESAKTITKTLSDNAQLISTELIRTANNSTKTISKSIENVSTKAIDGLKDFKAKANIGMEQSDAINIAATGANFTSIITLLCCNTGTIIPCCCFLGSSWVLCPKDVRSKSLNITKNTCNVIRRKTAQNRPEIEKFYNKLEGYWNEITAESNLAQAPENIISTLSTNNKNSSRQSQYLSLHNTRHRGALRQRARRPFKIQPIDSSSSSLALTPTPRHYTSSTARTESTDSEYENVTSTLSTNSKNSISSSSDSKHLESITDSKEQKETKESKKDK